MLCVLICLLCYCSRCYWVACSLGGFICVIGLVGLGLGLWFGSGVWWGEWCLARFGGLVVCSLLVSWCNMRFYTLLLGFFCEFATVRIVGVLCCVVLILDAIGSFDLV